MELHSFNPPQKAISEVEWNNRFISRLNKLYSAIILRKRHCAYQSDLWNELKMKGEKVSSRLDYFINRNEELLDICLMKREKVR